MATVPGADSDVPFGPMAALCAQATTALKIKYAGNKVSCFIAHLHLHHLRR
jgi:hypothetical protein